MISLVIPKGGQAKLLCRSVFYLLFVVVVVFKNWQLKAVNQFMLLLKCLLMNIFLSSELVNNFMSC